MIVGRNTKSALSITWGLVMFMGLLAGSLIASAGAQSYNEAPQLAELVAAGQLPPLEERLPATPLVVPVVERIGQYGSTLQLALLGPSDGGWLNRTIGYENLLRWTPDWSEYIPNIAESVEASEDATEYTFKLRAGMKWSDGHPFTADDILFWYEDVLSNEELSPGGAPAWLRDGNGDPVVVEKIDDTTVVFKFASPNGIFLANLASVQGSLPTNYPRHYLEQFHRAYNEENLDALVAQAGMNDWIGFFGRQTERWVNKDLPTLFAWRITTPYDGSSTQVVAERNPYYWKVDPEGKQLPYIDRIVYDIVANPEVMVLKTLSGEVDLLFRLYATLDNKAVFTDNMERGGYHFYEYVQNSSNTLIIMLNHTHNDPVKREIFQNKDFKIGLSYAIDRQEIIDAIFVSQGEPYQVAPRPGLFYNERLAKQYTEYNVDLANEHLDRAGYTERDAQGFRLGPDGRRISFAIEVTSFRPEYVLELELIQGYWREVGIDMQIRHIEQSLFNVRVQANEHDASVWSGGNSDLNAILRPHYYFPFNTESHYAILWAYWYMGDPQGEEPPAEVKRQMELFDHLKATGNLDSQIELMKEILEVTADQLYNIGTVLRPPGYSVVRNRLHNVPQMMITESAIADPAQTNPSQYFIEDRQ